jgi:hypothetical protein
MSELMEELVDEALNQPACGRGGTCGLNGMRIVVIPGGKGSALPLSMEGEVTLSEFDLGKCLNGVRRRARDD